MRYVIILSLIILISCNNNRQTEITGFRGPDRSGIYNEPGLFDSWPEVGPEEIFFTDSIGEGYGSPVIVDELIYVTGTRDSTAILFCIDMTGHHVWQLELGKEWIKNYPGSRSTPTIAGDLLYVGSGYGNLYCIDLETRSISWSKNMESDFNGILPMFGHSESPVVLDEKVFWTAGGKVHNVVVLNRFTGALIWSAPGYGERSAYNQPSVITLASGRSIFVTFTAYHLLGLDTDTGELLWSHLQDNTSPSERKKGIGDTHANPVLFENNNLYYAAGDGNCGVKLSINSEGTKISEVWRNTHFDSYMGGIIKSGDYLYGSGTRTPRLKSVHAETGIITDSLSIGSGVVIATDSMIYYYSQKGMMHLVSYNEGILEPVSAFRIARGTREHFSHPLIHKGVLYVRRGNALCGYRI
ncbi:MAG: PQQ-binding-like beta-propeller repeat protein [Bacteroidales bacterium]